MEVLLTEFVKRHDLQEIVAGAAIDLDKVPKKNQEGVLIVLLHCCINGPFTPHDVTQYPIIGEARLDDLVGHKVSNNGLRKTCLIIKDWLISQSFEGGFMQSVHGGFWPDNGFSSEKRRS